MKTNKEGIAIMNREELDMFYTKWLAAGKDKSILLMGPCGVGKTEFMRGKGKNIISANDIVGRYMLKGMEGITQPDDRGNPILYFGSRHNCIDDIGTEVDANHYGTKMDVISYVIQLAYTSNRPYHFTTNLNTEELLKKYGPRVYDRLKEMTYMIILDDTTFRKLSTIDDIKEIMNS
tara:strand:- start:447 stop:977 length:531 start_codon:yes stop_codon:yes gene_type:complete